MRQTLSAAIALTLASSALAQAPDELSDTTIDSRTRTQVFDGVLRTPARRLHLSR